MFTMEAKYLAQEGGGRLKTTPGCVTSSRNGILIFILVWKAPLHTAPSSLSYLVEAVH